MNGRPVGVRWRLAVLAAGRLALLTGLHAALLLLGLPVSAPPAPLEQVPGPLMVLGFVGTLVALERAVALGTRWALLAPASSAGGVTLVLTGPSLPGRLLLMLASVLLLLIYRRLWRRQPGPALLAQATGALAWYAATLLWLAGFGVPEIVPWLATFVVATIAGERLELAHVTLPRHGARWFLAALGTLTAGATATVLWPAVGAYLFGVGLLATVAWLAVRDVARRTVAPTAPVPYRPWLYAPLALLHGTLAVRVVAGDAFGVQSVWRWAGVGNVVAMLGFVGCVVAALAGAGRRTARTAAVPPVVAVVR